MIKEIWVDFEEREVYTDIDEVNELIDDYKQGGNYDYYGEFGYYLEHCYSTMEIFNFTDDEKENIEQEFNESSREDILQQMNIVKVKIEI